MSRDRRALGLLAAGHACADLCQGAVPALVPFLVAERGLFAQTGLLAGSPPRSRSAGARRADTAVATRRGRRVRIGHHGITARGGLLGRTSAVVLRAAGELDAGASTSGARISVSPISTASTPTRSSSSSWSREE